MAVNNREVFFYFIISVQILLTIYFNTALPSKSQEGNEQPLMIFSILKLVFGTLMIFFVAKYAKIRITIMFMIETAMLILLYWYKDQLQSRIVSLVSGALVFGLIFMSKRHWRRSVTQEYTVLISDCKQRNLTAEQCARNYCDEINKESIDPQMKDELCDLFEEAVRNSFIRDEGSTPLQMNIPKKEQKIETQPKILQPVETKPEVITKPKITQVVKSRPKISATKEEKKLSKGLEKVKEESKKEIVAKEPETKKIFGIPLPRIFQSGPKEDTLESVNEFYDFVSQYQDAILKNQLISKVMRIVDKLMAQKVDKFITDNRRLVAHRFHSKANTTQAFSGYLEVSAFYTENINKDVMVYDSAKNEWNSCVIERLNAGNKSISVNVCGTNNKKTLFGSEESKVVLSPLFIGPNIESMPCIARHYSNILVFFKADDIQIKKSKSGSKGKLVVKPETEYKNLGQLIDSVVSQMNNSAKFKQHVRNYANILKRMRLIINDEPFKGESYGTLVVNPEMRENTQFVSKKLDISMEYPIGMNLDQIFSELKKMDLNLFAHSNWSSSQKPLRFDLYQSKPNSYRIQFHQPPNAPQIQQGALKRDALGLLNLLGLQVQLSTNQGTKINLNTMNVSENELKNILGTGDKKIFVGGKDVSSRNVHQLMLENFENMKGTTVVPIEISDTSAKSMIEKTASTIKNALSGDIINLSSLGKINVSSVGMVHDGTPIGAKKEKYQSTRMKSPYSIKQWSKK